MDNANAETETPAELDILSQFSTMARWKAHELKHSHRGLEQPEALSEAFSRLQTWRAELQRFAKIKEDKEHADRQVGNEFWKTRLVHILSNPMANQDPAQTQLEQDGARLVESFLLAYGIAAKTELWAQSGYAHEHMKLLALERIERVNPAQALFRDKKKHVHYDPLTQLISGDFPPEESLGKDTHGSGKKIFLNFMAFQSHAENQLPTHHELNSARSSGTLDNLAAARNPDEAAKTILSFQGLGLYMAKGDQIAFESIKAAKLNPKIAKATETLREQFSDIEMKINQMATEQAMLWIEDIGAKDFIEKYWGGKLHLAKLQDIQTAIQHKDELLKAFEGNTALGVASIAIGSQIELLPKGNLPQRCFEALQQRHGLSRGGWRFISQIPNPLDFWHDALGTSLDPTKWSRLFASSNIHMHTSPTLDRALRSLLFKNNDINPLSEAEQDAMDAKNLREAQHAQLSTLCLAANLASSIGIAPKKSGDFLKEFVETHREIANLGQWGPFADTLMSQWAIHQRKSSKLAAQISNAQDYMSNAEPGSAAQLAGLGPEQAWTKMTQLSAQWHTMIELREKGDLSSISWVPLKAIWPSDPSRGLVFRELCDGGALYDEGKELHHCVSTYADRCMDGTRRILSMEANGAKSGTLELIFENEQWVRGQFKTSHNDNVRSEAANELADQAVIIANAAWKLQHDQPKPTDSLNQSIQPAAAPDLASRIAIRRQDPPNIGDDEPKAPKIAN